MSASQPEGYDQDLSKMLKDSFPMACRSKLVEPAWPVAACHKNHPYFEGAEKSTMPALAEWVVDSDKVITF